MIFKILDVFSFKRTTVSQVGKRLSWNFFLFWVPIWSKCEPGKVSKISFLVAQLRREGLLVNTVDHRHRISKQNKTKL